MWDNGYTTNVDYLSSYHIELNPLRVDLSLLYAGVLPPKIKCACELGFGQGLNIITSASTSDIKWYGNDFNPTQANHAKRLNSISESNAELSDASFEEFCRDETLPNFDFIALHGIWTWISDDNRKIICDFIKRKLNVGGVVYISYNTSPGWAGLDHLRHLMLDHFNNANPNINGTEEKIKKTLDFFKDLQDTEPLFLKKNPNILERLEKFKELDLRYLAHELFNKDWKLMNVVEISEYFTDTKLSYVSSAYYLDAIDVLNFSDEQATFLNSIPDGVRREAFKDIMVNQTFRRDLWVKGPIRLSEEEKFEHFLNNWVVLACNVDDIELKVTGVRGEANLQETIYGPIIKQFNGVGQVKLANAFSNLVKTHSKKQFCEAIIVLIGSKYLAPACDPKITKLNEQRALKINKHFVKQANINEGYQVLCSPITSAGVPVHRVDQLFTQYFKDYSKDPRGLAKVVFEILKSKGQTLIQDGKPLENDADNLKELEIRAKKFLSVNLDIYKRLKVL